MISDSLSNQLAMNWHPLPGSLLLLFLVLLFLLLTLFPSPLKTVFSDSEYRGRCLKNTLLCRAVRYANLYLSVIRHDFWVKIVCSSFAVTSIKRARLAFVISSIPRISSSFWMVVALIMWVNQMTPQIHMMILFSHPLWTCIWYLFKYSRYMSFLANPSLWAEGKFFC